ncbi:sensor domain-containing protein [Nonomuraea sp. NPDC055795]
MTRDALEALDRLAGGLGTAVLALFLAMAWSVTLVTCLTGVGLLALPGMIGLTRSVAERERARLGRRGEPVISPYGEPAEGNWAEQMKAAWHDPSVRRDLAWVAIHATMGLVLGLAGLALPIMGLRDVTFPLWWRLLPAGEVGSSLGVRAETWPAVLAVGLSGLLWLGLAIVLGPRLAVLQNLPGRRLLSPHASVDLSARVARLTATRAAALRAHAAELRRIERSLHDGAQNRLVAVVVTVAAARRALSRNPEAADPALERAQTAAEQALAELRGVVRGILPPVLEDKGLSGALSALAAGSAVPCGLSVGELGPLPLSVEATAYFTVAEALTNVARHSGATRVDVEVILYGEALRITVEDDGRGGAGEDTGGGSGLAGIRRRVESHDGVLTLSSPEGGPTRLEVVLPPAS